MLGLVVGVPGVPGFVDNVAMAAASGAMVALFEARSPSAKKTCGRTVLPALGMRVRDLSLEGGNVLRDGLIKRIGRGVQRTQSALVRGTKDVSEFILSGSVLFKEGRFKKRKTPPPKRSLASPLNEDC